MNKHCTVSEQLRSTPDHNKLHVTQAEYNAWIRAGIAPPDSMIVVDEPHPMYPKTVIVSGNYRKHEGRQF